MTAPFTREPLTAGQALSLRSHIFSVLIKQGSLWRGSCWAKRNWGSESNKQQIFVISPSVIFLRKTTAPSSEGACVCAKFSTCYILKVIINTSITTAAASPRPTPWDVKFTFTDNRNFSLPCVKGGAERTWGGGIVRFILYDFVKIPQSFFCSKKMTAPFTRELLMAGQALSYAIQSTPNKKASW